MLVGIHHDTLRKEMSYCSIKYRETLTYNKVDYVLLDLNTAEFWENLKHCDAFIFHWSHHDFSRQMAQNVLPVVENHLGIKCFPSQNSSWIYDDKIREYYLLRSQGFPAVRTWVFYDKTDALAFVRRAAYPVVFKLKSGAGASMVQLLDNAREAERYVRLMFDKGIFIDRGLPGSLWRDIKDRGLLKIVRKKFGEARLNLQGRGISGQNWSLHKNYILLQEYLPGNEYDTRVVVIGDRAWAFQRKNRPNDFRASGSKFVEMSPKKIDKAFIEIGFAVSKKLGFESMAYDFIYDTEGNPTIIELSYTFGSRKGSQISECPGFWDSDLDWHDGKFDPELAQLIDFLGMPELTLPDKYK